MQLVILGTKVAKFVESVISQGGDNIQISVFTSMDEFANATELRNISCERLIFTEEIVTGATYEDKRRHLQSFKAFLDQRYMDLTVISINHARESLDLCADVFYDANTLNIWIAGKVKPACMLALGNATIPELEEIFGMSTSSGLKRQEEEKEKKRVEQIKNDPMFAVSDDFKAKPEPEKQIKKKGLFGGFGKKKKSEDVDANAFAQGFSGEPEAVTPQASVPFVSTETGVAPRKRVKPAGFGKNKANPDPVFAEPTADNQAFDNGFDNGFENQAFDNGFENQAFDNGFATQAFGEEQTYNNGFGQESDTDADMLAPVTDMSNNFTFEQGDSFGTVDSENVLDEFSEPVMETDPNAGMFTDMIPTDEDNVLMSGSEEMPLDNRVMGFETGESTDGGMGFDTATGFNGVESPAPMNGFDTVGDFDTMNGFDTANGFDTTSGFGEEDSPVTEGFDNTLEGTNSFDNAEIISSAVGEFDEQGELDPTSEGFSTNFDTSTEDAFSQSDFDTQNNLGFDTSDEASFDTGVDGGSPSINLAKPTDVQEDSFADFDTNTPYNDNNDGFGDISVAPETLEQPEEAMIDIDEVGDTSMEFGNGILPSMQGGYPNDDNVAPSFTGMDLSMPEQPSASTYMGPTQPQRGRIGSVQPIGGNLQTANAVMPMNLDLATMSQYDEEVRPVKIIEKEVIKEVPRVVQVGGGGAVAGGATKYQNIIKGILSGIMIVTGDRRSGVTKTALTMATHFATKIPTLYVDLDLKRHGGLYYLGIGELSDSDTAVQNGLTLLKSGRDAKRYAFKSSKVSFDSLVSMPGTVMDTKALIESVGQLAYQSKYYKAIIIDCPVENLYLVEELMYSSDFYLCLDSDICSCSNLMFALNDVVQSRAVAEKALAMMYARSHYIVKVTEQNNEVISNLSYLEEIYELDDDRFNWARVPCAGLMDNIDNILINMV